MNEIDLEVGQVAMVNGRMVLYMGNGRFDPVDGVPAKPVEVMAKRFDAVGGPLSGQPVQGA